MKEGEKVRGNALLELVLSFTFILLPIFKISATGDVYNLKDISDFPGKYVEGRGGLTGAKGVAYFWVENDKKISIHIKAHTEGLALTLRVGDISVELVDEK